MSTLCLNNRIFKKSVGIIFSKETKSMKNYFELFFSDEIIIFEYESRICIIIGLKRKELYRIVKVLIIRF